MVKKWGRAMFYLSCIFSYTLYFLEKILLVSLRNIYNSACLNLNYGAAKQKPEWWDLSKLVTNTLRSLILALSKGFIQLLGNKSP